jgi:DNA modification methylase
MNWTEEWANKPQWHPKDPIQRGINKYKTKCLMGIPWRVAFALIDDGWILRNDIIWHKPNAMPSSVKDRLTQTYEHIFHFVKSKKYYYDLDAIREPHKTIHELFTRKTKPFGKKGSPNYRNAPVEESYGLTKHASAIASTFSEGLKLVYKKMKKLEASYQSKYKERKHGQTLQFFTREDALARMRAASKEVAKQLFPTNKRLQQDFINWVHDHAGHLKGKNPGDLWSIPTKPFNGAHFAVYPVEICIKPILSSSPPKSIVLDPMCGSGTTCLAAKKLGRRFIGIDINREYVKLARNRLKTES